MLVEKKVNCEFMVLLLRLLLLLLRVFCQSMIDVCTCMLTYPAEFASNYFQCRGGSGEGFIRGAALGSGKSGGRGGGGGGGDSM